jgi:hypothetical protein
MVAIVTFVQCPSTLSGSFTASHTSITTARGSNIALANFPLIHPIFLTDSVANADLDADAELRVENGCGFHLTTVKGHIDAAKAELDKEPKSAPWTNYLPFDVDRRAVLEGEDGRRRDVTELLDRLRELI